MGRNGIFPALQRAGIKCFKLHNDEMQRGVPDYLCWGPGLPQFTFELKVAESPEGAVAVLEEKKNAAQFSVLKSMGLSHVGGIVVWGCRERLGLSILVSRKKWWHSDVIPVVNRHTAVAADHLVELLVQHLDRRTLSEVQSLEEADEQLPGEEESDGDDAE